MQRRDGTISAIIEWVQTYVETRKSVSVEIRRRFGDPCSDAQFVHVIRFRV